MTSNRVGEARKRCGYSAAELAKGVGVSRQTIYAIEANSYVPNTAVALRLAALLDKKVEDLFQLDTEVRQADVPVKVIGDSRAGQPVQLCSVRGATIAIAASAVPVYLPAADGVIVHSGRQKRALAFHSGPPAPQRLVIGGCDPALSILATHAREAEVDVVLASCNSSQALELLRSGSIHIAGTHLNDPAAVRRRFPRGGVRIVTFASWQEGFVVALGNPKRIRSAADLARRGVRIVNREVGAGSRMLLDDELEKAGISGAEVRGYDSVAPGHLPAAWHVMSGLADCCVATEAASRAFGLDFRPIRSERFDLIVPADLKASATVERLLDAMQWSALRRQLETLGGYDTRETGRELGRA
jgi:putative molybdopterin biosynthesis protein